MAMCKIPSRKTVAMKAKRQMDASLGPAELDVLFPNPSHAAGYSHRNVWQLLPWLGRTRIFMVDLLRYHPVTTSVKQ